jgi:uncharacterized membrane protein YfcA
MDHPVLIFLAVVAGIGAGTLAGLIGIGGGIVIVPVIYYGLLSTGASVDTAAHVAVATSLAAIVPTSIISFLGHWRAGNTDFGFLREWGPPIAAGAVVAQLTTPHVGGSLISGAFGLLCLAFAVRFAVPQRFQQVGEEPPNRLFRQCAGIGIGAAAGFAGTGGGILTNIVMTLSGMPMHKSIGRAAAAGIVVSIPATIVATLASPSDDARAIGSVNMMIWACIAPAQAAGAWFGSQLASGVSAEILSRVVALALTVTGMTMIYSSMI